MSNSKYLRCEFKGKNAPKMEKLDKVYKPQNWKKEKKRKTKHWFRGICVFTLNKLWKNMLWN